MDIIIDSSYIIPWDYDTIDLLVIDSYAWRLHPQVWEHRDRNVGDGYIVSLMVVGIYKGWVLWD